MYGCLGINVIRFLLISWISNPWMILPLQAVQGCVLGLTWSTASSYISLVSPAHLKPTSQYMLLLLYHGIGKGLGTIMGGFIIASIGKISITPRVRDLWFCGLCFKRIIM